MPKTKKESELVTTNSAAIEFELNAEIIAGTLTSNAKELKAKVENELKNYSIEKYTDNPDSAKNDKAFLNKIKEAVAEKRKEITKTWNKPLDEFLNEMKTLEKSIDEASTAINNLVKVAEQEEKDQKKKQIEDFWTTLDNKLIKLDQIFNPRWLNKTYKIDQVMIDIDNITQKISSELDTLRSMQSEDSEILMAFYLETLDLNATLAKGNQLKNNREILKKQAEILQNPPKKEEKPTETDKKATENKQISQKTMSFTLKLFGTVEQLMALRKYIDQSGIKYEKL